MTARAAPAFGRACVCVLASMGAWLAACTASVGPRAAGAPEPGEGATGGGQAPRGSGAPPVVAGPRDAEGGPRDTMAGIDGAAPPARDSGVPDAAPLRDLRADVTAAACGLETIVPRAMFDVLFPPRYRHPVYTYDALVDAVTWSQGVRRLRGFAVTGEANTCKREVAAFFAHVDHETSHLRKIEETEKRPYCRPAVDCPCDPNTTDYNQMFFGRGPLQLSYNYHYCRASRDLGVDIHRSPGLVATDAVLTWKSALWFWMGRDGAGEMTPHEAMTNAAYGFGETIRSVNGAIDCGDAEKVKARVDVYLKFLQLLGASPEDASKLGC